VLARGNAEALELVGQYADFIFGGTFDLVSRRIAEERAYPLNPPRADMGGTAAQRMGEIPDFAQVIGLGGRDQEKKLKKK